MSALLIRLFIKDRDNVKDKNVRKKYGYLGSCTGIVLNIMLFLGKLIAGFVSGAVSVMADAFNNLSDAGSSIMSLVGFKMAAKAADEDHPFGHGRMEYISGLVISFIIMMMSIELGKSSFSKIFAHDKLAFSVMTFVILACSVAVKLWMWYFYRKLGKKINSTSLFASAADSLSDCAATGAVMLAMVFSAFTSINIDGYMGVLVALFIFRSGFMTSLILMLVLMVVGVQHINISLDKTNLMMYLGGIIGVFNILILNIIVPRISPVILTLLSFIGQLVSGMVIDAFVYNMFSISKILGCLIVIAGLVIYQLSEEKA